MDLKGMEFCPDCNNMLYPVSLPEERKLAYECKSCHYRRIVEYPDRSDQCIYLRELSDEKTAKEIDPDLCMDRTFSRVKVVPCERCGCETAVFFQNSETSGDVEMSLVYICCGRMPDGTLCGTSWIQGPKPQVEKKKSFD